MNHADLPAPPAGCTATLEASRDEIQLHYPPPHWQEFHREWMLGGLCTFFGLASLVVPVQVKDGPHPGIMLGVPGMIVLLWTIGRATIWGHFRLTSDELQLTLRGFCYYRRRRWDRADLFSVVSFTGLRIYTHAGVQQLFPRRDSVELAWIAAVISSALQLKPDECYFPDELAVGYTREPEQPAYMGFLRVLDGRLLLRRLSVPEPELVFKNVRWSGMLSSVPGIALFQSEVRTRLEDDDLIWLRIEKPSLRLVVWVWCDDQDGLQAALARFWAPAR